MRLAELLATGPKLEAPKAKKTGRTRTVVPPGYRKCACCGVVRPTEDYRKSAKSSDGRLQKCPDCDPAGKKARPVHGRMADPSRPGVEKTVCGARGAFLSTTADLSEVSCELCRLRLSQYAAARQDGSENVPD